MGKLGLKGKPALVLLAAVGIVMVSGSTGVWTFAQEGGGLPEGFVKGELAPEPPAEMIEAGKRVYFTKCVWCQWGGRRSSRGPTLAKAEKLQSRHF